MNRINRFSLAGGCTLSTHSSAEMLRSRFERALALMTCVFLLFPLLLFADADRQDWIGEYAMNHDGHPGTLRIVPSRRKCRSMPCPGLEVQYVDDHGAAYSGTVDVLDENGQHVAFTVEFPGNPQVFNVYIFSFDKTKLAGTTVWGGRTFGVLATKSGAASPMVAAEAEKPVAKRPAMIAAERVAVANRGTGTIAPAYLPSGTPSGAPSRVLLPDGTVEWHYPDGTVRSKRIGGCGLDIHYPDGRFVRANCTFAQVIPLVPPPPPSGSPEESWLRAQDADLLGILQGILGGANSADFQNYVQNYENPASPVIYKRIYYRTRAISELTSSPQ
jgi:hypothetical protein